MSEAKQYNPMDVLSKYRDVILLSRIGNRNYTFDRKKRNVVLQENTEINALNASIFSKCKEISLFLGIQEPQNHNMSINTKTSQAAKAFAQRWSGDFVGEKQETQSFWIDLMDSVFGIPPSRHFVDFEKNVKINGHEKYIDGYIAESKVLIEQKGSDVKLNKPLIQSDGELLTPFQQAVRYKNSLPTSEVPLYIVVCNFHTFELYDMEHPNNPPEIVELANLEKEFYRLSILVTPENAHIKKELEISIKAGEIVGVLYDKILAQYQNPDDSETHRSLNKLCVRLVFCLYAEDAGLFDGKSQFHDYMSQFSAVEFREKLRNLFRILDTKLEDRDPYEDEKLLAFPYVNGGMFAGDIVIPRITEEIRTLILQRAADDFDWSEISPTIFGAVFESTLNPDTRRAGGMHYTSIENIHRVIDPLFLDDLKAELNAVKATQVAKTRKEKAMAFQDKLASLSFLDPACGSGNFLTESYTSLRRLENEAIKIIFPDRIMGGIYNPIKVSISQFYGIEINDFACSVAQTALWIAESQMWKETDEIIGLDVDLLPLKSYNNIHEGNALRMDWETIIPSSDLDFIMGNPPFIGARIMSSSQKDDLIYVFGSKWKNIGNLDYVTGWYKKAFEMMQKNTSIRASLVSTNSITQGEQVANLWKPLMNDGVHIDYASRTFIWDSEASLKAHVHCVIIGFSLCNSKRKRYIYEGNECFEVANINAYLIDADNVFIESHTKPICNVPPLLTGSQRIDNDNYVFTDEEKQLFEKKEPLSSKYFRRWYGADEFINNRPRWCLYLGECSPAELKQMPLCLERVRNVREYRLSSNRVQTVKAADAPNRFGLEVIPEGFFMIVPVVSSFRRSYIPMGFMSPDNMCSNQVNLIPDAGLYHLGVLESCVHMAWVRAVAGRLKSDYRYSKDIVYNNFPWPEPSDIQKTCIERTAQAILDAREIYPDSTLADMYDPDSMHIELRRAHRENDKAVLDAYGFPKDASESDIVARLFKLYQEQCD